MVVFILVTLASIVLSVIPTVERRMELSGCMTRMRELGTAFSAYAGSHSGDFPPYRERPDGPGYDWGSRDPNGQFEYPDPDGYFVVPDSVRSVSDFENCSYVMKERHGAHWDDVGDAKTGHVPVLWNWYAITPEYVDNPASFICPGGKWTWAYNTNKAAEPKPASTARFARGIADSFRPWNVSYCFQPGLRLKTLDAGRAILACDQIADHKTTGSDEGPVLVYHNRQMVVDVGAGSHDCQNHENYQGVNAMYVDGHAETIPTKWVYWRTWQGEKQYQFKLSRTREKDHPDDEALRAELRKCRTP